MQLMMLAATRPFFSLSILLARTGRLPRGLRLTFNGSCYRREFETIVEGLSDALDFSRTIGFDSSASYEQGGGRGTLGEVDFYTR